MAKYTIYHVLPQDDEWAVKKEKADRASYKFGTKKEAVDKARALAKDPNTTVVVHRKDGTIEDTINPQG